MPSPTWAVKLGRVLGCNFQETTSFQPLNWRVLVSAGCETWGYVAEVDSAGVAAVAFAGKQGLLESLHELCPSPRAFLVRSWPR